MNPYVRPLKLAFSLYTDASLFRIEATACTPVGCLHRVRVRVGSHPSYMVRVYDDGVAMEWGDDESVWDHDDLPDRDLYPLAWAEAIAASCLGRWEPIPWNGEGVTS